MTFGSSLLRVTLAATGLLLASCGGGDTVNPFSPERLLVFGDESSVITDGTTGPAAGRKYTINALDPLDTTTTDPNDRTDLAPLGDPFNCGANRLWIQVLADNFGFRFAECNPDPDLTTQRGVIYARAGARAADIAAQVDAHLAGGGSFGNSDLAAVYAGQNDILDLYATATSAADCAFDSPSSAGTVAAEAFRRGTRVKRQVDRMADDGRGARVIFATVPNQALTPYGRTERAAHTDFDRGLCLRELTEAFNSGLRDVGINDGRKIGVVLLDDQAQFVIDNAGAFSYENVSEAACTVALPDCSTATLVGAAATDTYFWADDRHFASDFHERFGSLATSRVSTNPF